MPGFALPQQNREQWTFSIALALLGAIGAAQLIGFLYIVTRQPREKMAATRKAAIEAQLFRNSKMQRQSTAPVQVPAVAGVPPATVQRVPAEPATVAETLLHVARDFRERGDTANAISKLQQATALEPGNAEILAELALTYESMQLFERSNEVWRRLTSLGPGAGPLLTLAELKLQVGVSPQTNARTNNGSLAPDATQTSDAAGIPEGSTFGISEVSLKREVDSEADTRLLLRVGVKKRPETPIDHTKVKIQVFFYDMVNNDQVVLTNAEVSYEWITPGHDWAETGTEVLDVTYLRPKPPPPGTPLANQRLDVPDSVEKAKRSAREPKAAADILPASDTGPRQYLGYIVRVYYKDQLQAVRADPTRLLNLFPPPFTAPVQ